MQTLDSLDRLQHDIGVWADATFGAGNHNDRQAAHIIEELGECLDNPSDIWEFADVMHLFLDFARRNGHSATDVITTTVKKLAINKTREWHVHENGLTKHVEH